jgi:hypothetical protein
MEASMAVELNLTIDDETYAKVQRLAQKRQLDVTEMVAHVLDDLLLAEDEGDEAFDWAEPDEVVEREMQAYVDMHDSLKRKYLGKCRAAQLAIVASAAQQHRQLFVDLSTVSA